ncbi:PREDICTED: uncharacterized protein LOC102832424 [Chrysochloris asiatica]|uniref:Uncharacterized protein LOC102832424 n=1 Tax=Chrysochloris asiatica TaxID=185453 RepID=A0A9B0TV30_CHRAS|nr:PREDICTED: uncharacterized protein LOC102832424 [Chrysochloris asiatica]
MAQQCRDKRVPSVGQENKDLSVVLEDRNPKSVHRTGPLSSSRGGQPNPGRHTAELAAGTSLQGPLVGILFSRLTWQAGLAGKCTIEQATGSGSKKQMGGWRMTQMCINYNNEHPIGWYIWLLLLIFLVALLCGAVLFCLQCWLKRSQVVSPRHTMAVFAVGDLDHVYGMEAAMSTTIGIHRQTQNTEPCPVPCLGPPPPYEEILKTSQL